MEQQISLFDKAAPKATGAQSGTRLTQADRIYSAVQDAPGLSYADYATLTDISPASASSTLAQLYLNGYLRRDHINGKYLWYVAKPRKLGSPLQQLRHSDSKPRKPKAVPKRVATSPTPSAPAVKAEPSTSGVVITVQGVTMTIEQARSIWADLTKLFG